MTWCELRKMQHGWSEGKTFKHIQDSIFSMPSLFRELFDKIRVFFSVHLLGRKNQRFWRTHSSFDLTHCCMNDGFRFSGIINMTKTKKNELIYHHHTYAHRKPINFHSEAAKMSQSQTLRAKQVTSKLCSVRGNIVNVNKITESSSDRRCRCFCCCFTITVMP